MKPQPLARGAGEAGDLVEGEVAVAVLGRRLAEGGDEARPLGVRRRGVA
jgi:hypothetical protein